MLLLLGPTPDAYAQVPQQSIHPGKTGQALITALQADYTPSQTLGYDVARDEMYRYLDTRDGVLIGVYGGYSVDIPAGQDPSSTAYQSGSGISAEHTWPQSKGSGNEPQKSDMHHLFPVKQTINSARSNRPYSNIVDSNTDTWYIDASSQSSIPASNIDGYSENDGSFPSNANYSSRFEPREVHKGNAARAVFYYYVIYNSTISDPNFFEAQKDVLLQWHEQDAVDQNEYDRSQWIAEQQGTNNPFVLDTTLVRRAFGTASSSPTVQLTASSVSAAEGDGSVDLTAQINNPDGNAVDVDLGFDSGSSTATTADIGSYATQTITFGSGATSGDTQTVTVTLTDDDAVEGDEVASFALENLQPSGAAALGSNQTLDLLIEDNDTSPLVINEILADPASGITGDANGDGTRDFADDEFVEIYNTGTSAVDMSGYVIEDEVGVRHTVPEGTRLDPGVALTVFGGGTPTGIPGVVQTASGGQLRLNNSGDTVTLKDASGGTLGAVSYGGEGSDNQSLTRSPDFTGSFVKHTTISSNLFSPGATTDGVSLPVELAMFDVTASGSTATLAWTTASERSNAGFHVQRATRNGWLSLGFVEGAGTTDTPQDYRFRTEALSPGPQTFRLKQVDVDGTTSLSSEQTVTIRTAGTLVLTGPNPIPSGQQARLVVQVGTAQHVDVVLYNVLGQQVQMLFDGTATPGTPAEATLAPDGLASGVYFVRATGETVRATERIAIVR